MPLPPLIQALLSVSVYPHPVERVRLIETHISWVLIAGAFAYKIKKPVDFGFLDFSSLEQRRYFCAEEVRLNRRLAPGTYLGVVDLYGPPESPRFNGNGPVIEHAVQMRAFPPDATLDRAPVILPAQVDAIAERIAAFQQSLPPMPPASAWGTTDAVFAPVEESLAQLKTLCSHPGQQASLARLAPWFRQEQARLADFFTRRKALGCIREGHGDLHLGNIAWVDESPLFFDCIEFSPALRHVDVLNEIAFLMMDLFARHQPALAWRLINRWLEHLGDYAGLDGLRFYLAYRALVRAKVAALRATQDSPDRHAEIAAYLALAERLSQPGPPLLLLMHGVSGCGKTWVSQRLLESLGAIRLRSDVERKRLFGLAPLDDSIQAGIDLYTPEAGQRTFDQLHALAGGLLGAGFRVIIDATFLDRALRQHFLDLATHHACSVQIISVTATPDTCRQRLTARQDSGGDASEASVAVLERQLRSQDPLDAQETALTLSIDTTHPDRVEGQLDALIATIP